MATQGKNWVLLRAVRKVMNSETSTMQEIIDASRLYAQIQGVLPVVGGKRKPKPLPEEAPGINRLMAHVEEVKPS